MNLLTSSWGTRAYYSETSCDFCDIQKPATREITERCVTCRIPGAPRIRLFENANTVLSFSLVSSPERQKRTFSKTLTKSGAMEVFEYVDVIATLARRHEPSQATMLHPSASRLFYSERKEEGRP